MQASDVPLYPLIFEPFLRPMPWGGQRLQDWVAVPFPSAERIGEAWLLSDHQLHASRITNGPLAGRTLREVMAKRDSDLLGHAADRFPLLVKLLDAHENLSVQVHPDEAAARHWAPAEGGKTEAWLILSAEPGATLYIGLRRGIDKPTLLRELATGNVSLCLQRYEPKPGEVYFVPAGTIHALGGGVVVLEVQQTSDATFRLYDWNRTDSAGKPRALHLDAGMACLKESNRAGLQRASDILVACEFFTMRRLRVEQPVTVSGPSILFVLDGEVAVRAGGNLTRGATLLAPAVGMPAELIPQPGATIVEVKIP